MLSVSMIALAATMVSCSKDDNGGNGGNGGNNKPEPETWAGTWEITSSQTLEVTILDEETGEFEENVVNTKKTGTLVITPFEDDTYDVLVYGLSPDADVAFETSIPAFAKVTANDELEIYPEVVAEVEGGYTLEWAGLDLALNSVVTGEYPALTFDFAAETTGDRYTGNLSTGEEFTADIFEAFIFSTMGVSSIYMNAYAGDITLTFVSDEVSTSTASKAALSTLNPDMKMVYPAKVAKVAVAR